MGKLIYFIIVTPELSLAIGVASQFMQDPSIDHQNVVIRLLRRIKKAP